MLSREEILQAEPELSTLVQTGLSFPNDWQVENRKLLAALRRYAELNGIEIVENSAIDELIVDGGRVRGAAGYQADATVLATGAWTSLIKFGNQASPINIKPIRGQMIWFDCGEKLLDKVVYGPGCYLVPRADGRILAGSTTEDVGFEKGSTESAIEHLSAAAYEILPALRAFEVAGSWSGLRPRSDDERPVIGSPTGFEDLIVATGHYRNGILAAPHTAKIVAERIVSGARSAYFDAFDPNRFASSASANAK
jgi:glycine oxidase